MDRSPADELQDLVDVEKLKKDSQEAPYKATKGRWVLAIGVGIMLMAGMLFALSWMENQEAAKREAAQAVAAKKQAKGLAEQVLIACRDPRTRTDDIEALCQKAVDTKREVTQKDTDAGPDVVLSPAVLRQAVAEYCTQFTCKGADGESGVDGEDAVLTDDQLLDAVTRYCDDGRCSGPAGATGSPGAEGPQGPGPSDEQVASAVESYCAVNNCIGPKGEKGERGETGATGPAGRGITSVTCGSDDNWTITYSDGATETVTGPCRTTSIIPDPTDTTP